MMAMLKLWNDEMRRPCDSTPAMAGYGVIPLSLQNSVLFEGIKFQHLIKIVWETKTPLSGNVSSGCNISVVESDH